MLRIQELRSAKNLTQRELAEQIGVRNYIVANWEQNRTEPSLQDLMDLADFFECSIDYLVGRENDFGQIVLMKDHSDEFTEMWSMFNNLTKEKRNAVIELIKVLQK